MPETNNYASMTPHVPNTLDVLMSNTHQLALHGLDVEARLQSTAERASDYQRQLHQLRGLHDLTCQTVAEMHAAAFGGDIRGPNLGAVEDVADLYRRWEAAEEKLTHAAKQREELAGAIEEAWGVILSVGLHDGGWEAQDPRWLRPAETWRDKWVNGGRLADELPSALEPATVDTGADVPRRVALAGDGLGFRTTPPNPATLENPPPAPSNAPTGEI